MQFLIVEDDAVIADHVLRGLTERSLRADHARSGAEALAALRSTSYDGMVLDRMLPDISGTALLEHLRSLDHAVPPVLMLSALGSVTDRVEGLDAGADDYLAKPFSMAELVARLNAITRRASARTEGAALAVGRLVLDPSSHSASFGTESLQLNRKLYSLLAHMMRHADRVVTRDMLIQEVWGYAFAPTTNIVESNMSRLRAKLQALGPDPIETQRGSGYILRSNRCG